MSVQNISLVLGSGGARGHAHIGVIKALDERDFNVTTLSGTSMGALIGGVYAAGDLDKYTQWARALSRRDVFRLLDVSFSGAALFKGDRVFDTLRSLIGDRKIEELDKGFTAIATDVEAQREVWLNEGSLFDAIRASAAVPGVISPVNWRGRTLVDGGLLNPIPIAPTLNDATDLTVAVDLAGRAAREPKPVEKPPEETDYTDSNYAEKVAGFFRDLLGPNSEREPKPSAVRLLADSFETMQTAVSRLKFAAYQPDIIIEIPRNSCSFFDFHRTAEMIDIGYNAAVKALDDANSSRLS